jgi:methylthioribose-1-phosphate isomerase
MKSIEWIAGKVRFIDQTKLPHEEVYIETSDYRVVGEAIRRLQIRGAPAIGVAAAYAVLLAVDGRSSDSPEETQSEFYAAINYLSQTRPTAVNLFLSLKRMRRVFEENNTKNSVSVLFQLLQEAKAIHREDVEACEKIGEFGAALIEAGFSILTHCNTGVLATTGEGTAQAIITTAAKQQKIVRVYVDETRPLLQGARLTSWELVNAGIETILITDSTAGFLMQQRKVNAVIVGADRIAANGDVANKVGTYSLAVLAERHKIPFYVAAPTSTIDIVAEKGTHIPIEERDSHEITHINGVRVAANGVKVYAPAFDVTPSSLVTAIITEAGVLKPPYNESVLRVKQQMMTMHAGHL